MNSFAGRISCLQSQEGGLGMKGSQFTNGSRSRALLSILTFIALLMAACSSPPPLGASQTTTPTSVSGITATAPQQSPTSLATASITPFPTLTGTSQCPNTPANPQVVADFEDSPNGWGPEETPDPSVGKVVDATPVQGFACHGRWSLQVKTTLSGAPKAADSLQHTVLLLGPGFPPTDLSSGYMFGCYFWIGPGAAAPKDQAFLVQTSAVDSKFRNDISSPGNGSAYIVPSNIGRWFLTYVNILQDPNQVGHSSDGKPFDAKDVRHFSVGIWTQDGSPAFSGMFFLDYCVIAKGWHSPSDPTNM